MQIAQHGILIPSSQGRRQQPCQVVAVEWASSYLEDNTLGRCLACPRVGLVGGNLTGKGEGVGTAGRFKLAR